MQITEKQRADIALALPSLGLEEAKRIAAECHCSHDTVYREWRKIRGTTPGKVLMTNPVVLSLSELAIKRRNELVKTSRRINRITQQLS